MNYWLPKLDIPVAHLDHLIGVFFLVCKSWTLFVALIRQRLWFGAAV